MRQTRKSDQEMPNVILKHEIVFTIFATVVNACVRHACCSHLMLNDFEYIQVFRFYFDLVLVISRVGICALMCHLIISFICFGYFRHLPT